MLIKNNALLAEIENLETLSAFELANNNFKELNPYYRLYYDDNEIYSDLAIISFIGDKEETYRLYKVIYNKTFKEYQNWCAENGRDSNLYHRGVIVIPLRFYKKLPLDKPLRFREIWNGIL